MIRNAGHYADPSVADAAKAELDEFNTQRKEFGTAATSVDTFYSNY